MAPVEEQRGIALVDAEGRRSHYQRVRHRDEAIGPRVRQRPEQNRVHRREDRRGGGETDGERQDGGDAEAARPEEPSRGMSKGLQHAWIIDQFVPV